MLSEDVDETDDASGARSSPILVTILSEDNQYDDMSPSSSSPYHHHHHHLSSSPAVTPLLPELCVTEPEDLFQFQDLDTNTTESNDRLFEDEDNEYIPVSTSPASKQYLSTLEEETSSPSSSYSLRPRMSKISPRRLSLSLAESFNQLEIPFKPRRKASAPVVSSFDERDVDRVKMEFINMREVRLNNLKTTCQCVPELEMVPFNVIFPTITYLSSLPTNN